ncbi:hypothetical protein CGZ95_18650 [Enemella evansiae]|nr:hypothetical protein CGZ95_18650 [Enemella evansiae]
MVQLVGAKVGASLLGLSGLAFVVVVLVTMLGALTALALQILIPLIIVAVVVLVVLGATGGGCMMVLGGLFAQLFLMPFHFLLGGAARGAGRNEQMREVEIPVIPFTVTDASGTRTEVVIRGELKGGDIHQGDRVEVRGRGRSGVLEAKLVRNLDTGSQTRPRTHPAVFRSRAVLIGGLLVFAVTALFAISLYTSGLG